MQQIKLPLKRKFNWKMLALLAVALAIASFLVLPYQLTIVGEELAPGEIINLSIGRLIDILLFTALAAAGYFLATRIGTGMPFIEGWLNKTPLRGQFKKVLLLSVIVGILVSLIILAVSAWVFKPALLAEYAAMGVSIPEEQIPTPWQGFLASFYGGIAEEVQLRLFAMTFIAWLGGLLFRDEDGRPKAVVFWTANILAAILFGLGHLPATKAMGIPLSALVITSTVTLNAIGGIAFGWLYWKKGLESAMLSHFSADIVIHVILPLIVLLVAS